MLVWSISISFETEIFEEDERRGDVMWKVWYIFFPFSGGVFIALTWENRKITRG